MTPADRSVKSFSTWTANYFYATLSGMKPRIRKINMSMPDDILKVIRLEATRRRRGYGPWIVSVCEAYARSAVVRDIVHRQMGERLLLEDANGDTA